MIQVEHDRALRCVERLDTDAVRYGYLADPEVTLGKITLACTVAFADAFLPMLDWRGTRKTLTAWFDAFNARPSMQATLPVTG